MTLKPREKLVAIGVAAAVGLYALDSVLLSPLFARLAVANQSFEKDSLILQRSNAQISNGGAASARWRKISENRIGGDASAAQSKLLNHVGNVARDAGVVLTSYKPDHGEKALGFARTGIRAGGNATMSTLSRFLQRLQTADIPIRVTDLQVKANKPGTDDLNIELGLSTIYQLPVEQGK